MQRTHQYMCNFVPCDRVVQRAYYQPLKYLSQAYECKQKHDESKHKKLPSSTEKMPSIGFKNASPVWLELILM